MTSFSDKAWRWKRRQRCFGRPEGEREKRVLLEVNKQRGRMRISGPQTVMGGHCSRFAIVGPKGAEKKREKKEGH